MEEMFLHQAPGGDLGPRGGGTGEFVASLLEAFSRPDDSECWTRVRGALRDLEASAAQLELRGRRDVLHYLKRLSAFLHSEDQVVQKEELLQLLRQLVDVVSAPKDDSEILPPSSGLLLDADLSYGKYHSLGAQKPGAKAPLLSAHGRYKDDLFLYEPSSLPRYSPHPPPVSVADLRRSLPAVLSQVTRLSRGRRGLGITEQPLDLHLPPSLSQPPEPRDKDAVSPPVKSQLPPIPQGISNKSTAKVQMKSPKTGEDVIKYFASGGENRFFYLKTAPSPCQDPYRLATFCDSALQAPPPSFCKEFYTMSAFGLVRNLPDGTTESSSLAAWQREATLFKALRRLPFFRLSSLLRALRRWRRMAALSKQEKVREFLHENLLRQVTCFTPILHSASEWNPRLQALELFPPGPVHLLPIEAVDRQVCAYRLRVLAEARLLYAEGAEQLERLCASLRQELSYCEQSVQLEDRRAAASKALPLSTQSRSLRRLMHHRARVLAAVRMVPRLCSFLEFCLHSALKQQALAASRSYLRFLSVSPQPQEDAPAVISLPVGVVLESGVYAVDCLTKRSDLYDMLLAPFSEHYHDLEKIDQPLLRETTSNELEKASKIEEEKPVLRPTKLSFVRQVMAHSILTEEQGVPSEDRPQADHRRGPGLGYSHAKKKRM